MEAFVTIDIKGRENFSTRKNLRLPVSQVELTTKYIYKKNILKNISQVHFSFKITEQYICHLVELRLFCRCKLF